MRTWKLPVVGLLFLVGCSRGLSRNDAAAKLDQTFQDSIAVFFLDVGRLGTKCADGPFNGFDNQDPTRDFRFVAAERVGLVTVKADRKDFWKVDLTDAGRSASNDLKGRSVRTNGCNYQLVGFLLGKRSPVTVTDITTIDNTTDEVSYTWHWIPNDLGTRIAAQLSPAEIADLKQALKMRGLHGSFHVPDGGQSASESATQQFKKFDDGWRMVP